MVPNYGVHTFQPIILIYRRVILFVIIWDVNQFIVHCPIPQEVNIPDFIRSLEKIL